MVPPLPYQHRSLIETVIADRRLSIHMTCVPNTPHSFDSDSIKQAINAKSNMATANKLITT